MEREDKFIAEQVISFLCKGSEIGGLRFESFPQLLLTGPTEYRYNVSGQVFINIETRFIIFPSMPDRLPNSEDEIEDLDEEKVFNQLFNLRKKLITDIQLGSMEPHLIITFDTGEVLFINGKDNMYESWQLGVAYNDNNGYWLVVSCPGGGVAVWAPEVFMNDLEI